MFQFGVDSILQVIQEILFWVFGDAIPANAYRFIGYFLLFILVLSFLYLLLFIIGSLKKILGTEFLPIFYKPAERARRIRRSRFAEHIDSEIRRLNLLEEWHDYQYADLEAEVEAEGDTLNQGMSVFAKKRN